MRLAAILPALDCLSLVTAGIGRRQADKQSTSLAANSGSIDAASTTAETAPSTEQNSETGITGSGSHVDSDAGASGSEAGSFSLSRGGLITIIIVVACVVVFGIASTVLWVLAKRRQWNIRQSIGRASRRFTGRAAQDASREKNSRRGVQMCSIVPERTIRKSLFVQVDDAEKEPPKIPRSASKAIQQQSKWSEKLWRNDWQK